MESSINNNSTLQAPTNTTTGLPANVSETGYVGPVVPIEPAYVAPSAATYTEITPVPSTATYTHTADGTVPQTSTIESNVPVQGGYATQTTTNTTTTNKAPFGKRVEAKSNEVVAKMKNMAGRFQAKRRARKGNKAQPGEKLETYVDPAPIQTGQAIGTAGL